MQMQIQLHMKLLAMVNIHSYICIHRSRLKDYLNLHVYCMYIRAVLWSFLLVTKHDYVAVQMSIINVLLLKLDHYDVSH